MDIETEVRTISVGEGFSSLSPRERQVTAMSVRGMTTKEVGRSLGISHRTVEDHKISVYRKTGLPSMAEIIFRLVGSPKVVA